MRREIFHRSCMRERQVSEVGSLLVIRRDNIGDLVCTTPLIAALRQHYPRAWIGVLANSYNAPVLAGNPDVDQVLAYRKLKHLEAGQGALGALGARASMLWSLRRRKLDLAVVAAGAEDLRGARLARMLSPRRIVQPPIALPGEHEVEHTFSAARMLGIEGGIPPLCVVPGTAAVSVAREALHRAGMNGLRPLIGVHISARRPAQRWPAERFVALIMALNKHLGSGTMLFWSPGAEDHPQHPGDDGKAAAIVAGVGAQAALLPCPTASLADLIGALSLCDAVVCSDGGAMHLSAGLGKPVACFFGDSPVARWRPWGVPHAVLQAETRRVEDVPVEAAIDAVANLLQAKP